VLNYSFGDEMKAIVALVSMASLILAATAADILR
jgi:hypothetical protein